MCGRHRLSRRKQVVEEHFDSVSGEEDWLHAAKLHPPKLYRLSGKIPENLFGKWNWFVAL
jgi:hypothetical protein